jgi:hypothetical protein
LHNHPSVVVWVLFNEDWGAYDQARLAKWMKQLDPSRLLDGHTGGYIDNPSPTQAVEDKWISSDVTDIHTYPGPKMPPSEPGKARVLGEFGGIGVQIDDNVWDFADGWGYVMTSPAGLATMYDSLLKQVKQLETDGLSASVYTQPFDAETEENGLITYDREIIKIPLGKLSAINECLVPGTTSSTFDAAEFPVKTAEPSYPNAYQALLQKYENGRRDPQFVRALARRARLERDEANASKISADYIASQQDVFTAENLQFLRDFVVPNDIGFRDRGMQVFYRDGDKVDRLMDQKGYSQAAIDLVITRTEIDAFTFPAGDGKPSDAEPNWAKITETISKKYGAGYAQCNVLRAIALWYELKQDWPASTKSGAMLLEECGVGRTALGLNEIAWEIFLHSDDKEELEATANWARQEAQKHPKDGNRLDTYSNLLYKLGRTTEALESQQRAVQLTRDANAPFLKEIEQDLELMKQGGPTWLHPDSDAVRMRMKHYFLLDK